MIKTKPKSFELTGLNKIKGLESKVEKLRESLNKTWDDYRYSYEARIRRVAALKNSKLPKKLVESEIEGLQKSLEWGDDRMMTLSKDVEKFEAFCLENIDKRDGYQIVYDAFQSAINDGVFPRSSDEIPKEKEKVPYKFRNTEELLHTVFDLYVNERIGEVLKKDPSLKDKYEMVNSTVHKEISSTLFDWYRVHYYLEASKRFENSIGENSKVRKD